VLFPQNALEVKTAPDEADGRKSRRLTDIKHETDVAQSTDDEVFESFCLDRRVFPPAPGRDFGSLFLDHDSRRSVAAMWSTGDRFAGASGDRTPGLCNIYAYEDAFAESEAV
jgi:hypothetical protein